MKALMIQMPAIQAQEDLRLAAAVAYGSGTMKRQDARSWARERRRTARGPKAERSQALTDLPPQEAADRLAALGIDIQFVPAEATP